MSIQQNKRVGFPLAFKIYSYGSIDWDNPPLTKEYPYLSKELLEIFLYQCLEHSLLEFIAFPIIKPLITKPFRRNDNKPKIFTDREKINQRINYFIKKILSNQVTIIGTDGEVQLFLKLFKNLYWAINGISIEQAARNINDLVDQDTLSAIAKLPCKNLFFINYDCNPIYLLQANNIIDI